VQVMLTYSGKSKQHCGAHREVMVFAHECFCKQGQCLSHLAASFTDLAWSQRVYKDDDTLDQVHSNEHLQSSDACWAKEPAFFMKHTHRHMELRTQ
jgi:hypothetical protein